MTTHVPVLLQETLDALAVKAGGVYVDGTLGRAGHTREILRRGGAVLGIDRDDQAIAEVTQLKESAEKIPATAWFANLTIKKGCHGDLSEIAKAQGIEEVDGIMLDLGVSSPQLDEADRGFSFRADGPLDMRMDRTRRVTAADVVNTYGESELMDIFRTYGEEPNARRIAKAIVCARARERFSSTLQLAGLVEKTVGRHGAHHPATRVFQALRMLVNDEIGELMRALDMAQNALKNGNKTLVVSSDSPIAQIFQGQW